MRILKLEEDDVKLVEMALTLAVHDLDGWYSVDLFARTLDKVRQQNAAQELDVRLKTEASDTTPPVIIALNLLALVQAGTTDGAPAIVDSPP